MCQTSHTHIRRAPVILGVGTAAAMAVIQPAQASGQTIDDDTLAEKVAAIDEVMNTYFDLGRFQGSAIIAVDGTVIYRRSFGLANIEWDIPNTPDTRYSIASHGKLFTAAIILQLAEEGLVDLHEPISTYLPEYRKDNGDRITIHHLLSHTSGIPRTAPQWEAVNYREPFDLADALRFANELDLNTEPGTTFNYSNLGYNLLGAIVEHVTGQPYEEVLHERILEPLDMQDTGLVKHAPIIKRRAANYNRHSWGELINAPYGDESFAIGAGGMYSTVDDMLKWYEGLLGDALLSEESKALMLTKHPGGSGYGCGIGRYVKADDSSHTLMFGMGGTNGAASVSFRLVDDQISIILLGNIRPVPQGSIASNITNILVDLPANPIPESFVASFYDRLIQQHLTPTEDLPTEAEINRLGYELLAVDRIDDAIRVLAFNVSTFPESWNTYDSLGEALALAGQRDRAIANYRRSIELNPGNTNGHEALKRLEQR